MGAAKKTKAVMIGEAKAGMVELWGRQYLFLYNGRAMFAIQEEFDLQKGPLPDTDTKTMQGMQNLLRICEILSEQAEAKLKKDGYESEAPFRKEQADPLDTHPITYLLLRQACMDAVTFGYVREEEDPPGTVDLVTLKRQKKSGEKT